MTTEEDGAAGRPELPGLTIEQTGALRRFARLKAGAVFMEQGMGKSRVAVELANHRARARRVDAVLWVAPCSVLSTVQDEVERWGCDVPVRYLGYQTLSQADRAYLETLAWAKTRKLLIVADESGFIKNGWSKRHQRMVELRRHAAYALALNGTPLTRDLWDVKRQMDWLHPRILGTSDRAFGYRYFTLVERSDPARGRRAWFEVYEPNVKHLRSLMERYIFEARLDIGLPEAELDISHDAGAGTRERYEAERDEFFAAWERYGEEIALYRLLGNLKRIAACCPDKCASVAERVDGQHTIVFCQYRAEQDTIAAALTGDHLVMSGSTPARAREEIFARFRAERLPLLVTYGTGSFGLNLQHVASAHFASLPFDFGQVEQARSRIRRLGQQHPLVYTTHTSDLGIDTLVARNLRNKSWLAQLMRREIDPSGIL
ncbi:DEAD/DEAH box helicase [Streptomyces yaizuensis]|uniref:DEAD/DEAH box helicase n=1 Tax=Streptomyces yaizuensis TaxID=2989713 RepID=A0ABQ5P6G0_9ACTN|nr:DEAD/DEAH box helicase [Streptomyces sp. YSPA8]GLF98172.1 DEAD/DEAH box helicase [Streptomyces sp. YSPA8]